MKDDIQQTLEEDYGYNGDPETTDTPYGLHSNLKVNKRDGDTGTLEESREVKNIITNDGADLMRLAFGSAASELTSAFRWTAIGTSAGAAFVSGDTQLHTEIARSKNSFNTTANWGQFSNVTTFTNLAADVRESGLFNRDTTNGGTMLAAQTFGAISLTTNDKLEVIWKVFFSEA